LSNFLSIATVTAGLKQRLLEAVAEAGIPNASVTTDRPDQREKKAEPGINIFLFQTTPNAAGRNADLPAYRGNGAAAQRPRAAVDLQYLLTFYGDHQLLEPQRLLGMAVTHLHSWPVLTAQEIQDNVVSPPTPPGLTDPRHYLTGSDLAHEVERVRFTPLLLSTEELSRLWSVVFQTPYSLSAAYQATVVFLEPGTSAQPSLPVRDRNIYVQPFLGPRVERVLSAIDAALPITIDSGVVIEGSNLRGDATRVLLAGNDFEPPPQHVHGDRIDWSPPATLPAGVLSLQVTHRMDMGTPPTPHRGVESNAVALILHPRILNLTNTPPVQSNGLFATDITVQVTPLLRTGQRVSMVLNHAAGGPAYRFDVAPLTADTASVTIGAAGLQPGSYYVRLLVDGAESTLLDVDPLSPTFKQFIAPQLAVP
jgi:hypothetical protein